MLLPLLTLLTLQPAALADTEIRAVQVAITGEDGQPIDGLIPEEIALLENGLVRDVASVRRDDRPLTVAIVVDTSQAMASSLRLHVIDAVSGMLRGLPAGARYTLWTTGDAPRRVVELTDDRGAGPKALRRAFPVGGSTLLDALLEAMDALAVVEGERNAIIAVAGEGVDFSNVHRRRVVDRILDHDVVFFGVLLGDVGGDAGTQATYGYVFDELSRRTGGLYRSPLTSMRVVSELADIAADLAGQYRIRYATVAGLENRELEVQVARPDTKVRVSVPERVEEAQ